MALAAAGITLFLYAPTLSQPFVQDDWTLLHEIRSTSLSEYAIRAFSPANGIFFRPLAMLAFRFLYALSGPDPFPFHILLLLLHAANGVLAALVIEAITGRRGLAAASGLLCIAATTITGDTLLWIVGLFDLGATFCVLLSFLFLLRGRPVLSAALFLAALLCKEAAFPFLFVFAGYALLLDRSRLGLLWPHVSVAAMYALVRLAGMVLPAHGHPYAYGLAGGHLFVNAGLLLSWAVEAVIPFWSPTPQIALGVLALGLALLVFLHVARKKRVTGSDVRELFFFAVWVACGVLAVLPLTHHLFRYYALYSLPPLFVLVLMSGETLMGGPARRLAGPVVATFLMMHLAVNFHALRQRFAVEPFTPAVYDGTNHLIRKAHAVRTAQRELVKQHPAPPHGAAFVVSGIELDAFGGEKGLRFWYGDTSLRLYTPARYDSLKSAGASAGGQVHVVHIVPESDARESGQMDSR